MEDTLDRMLMIRELETALKRDKEGKFEPFAYSSYTLRLNNPVC